MATAKGHKWAFKGTVNLGPINDGSHCYKSRPPHRTKRRDGPRRPDGRLVPQLEDPHNCFSSHEPARTKNRSRNRTVLGATTR